MKIIARQSITIPRPRPDVFEFAVAYPFIRPIMPIQERWMRRGLERIRDELTI